MLLGQFKWDGHANAAVQHAMEDLREFLPEAKTSSNRMSFQILLEMSVRRSDVRTMFVCEALLLGMIGAVLGALAALLAAAIVNHAGLTWVPPGYVIVLAIQVLVWGDWTMICAAAGGLLAVAIFAAWWPANRAARALVVESLRHT